MTQTYGLEVFFCYMTIQAQSLSFTPTASKFDFINCYLPLSDVNEHFVKEKSALTDTYTEVSIHTKLTNKQTQKLNLQYDLKL